jgi:hypothetical protein
VTIILHNSFSFSAVFFREAHVALNGKLLCLGFLSYGSYIENMAENVFNMSKEINFSEFSE